MPWLSAFCAVCGRAAGMIQHEEENAVHPFIILGKKLIENRKERYGGFLMLSKLIVVFRGHNFGWITG